MKKLPDAESNEKERCWKKIGVLGKEKPTCPELSNVIHCRNCDVFIRAGRNLLERKLPETYLDEWTQVMAARKTEEPPGTVSVLIFRIGGEWLAFPTRLFAEITDLEKLHSLPHRKNPVLLGLVNVHGEIQLCVSLKNMLDIKGASEKAGDRKRYKRMMVVNHNGEKWVFPVDEIHGVYRINPENFQNVPVTVAKSGTSFTRHIFRWKDKNAALLDDELVFATLKRSVQ